MPSIEKSQLLKLIAKNEEKDKRKMIDMLLTKGKIKINKRVFLFDEISSSFMNILILVNEALNFLRMHKKNIIYQLQMLNAKIKKNEIYSHTGFDVILKTIEAEFENIETSSQIDETKLKKIFDFYTLLKKTLEESIILLDNATL